MSIDLNVKNKIEKKFSKHPTYRRHFIKMAEHEGFDLEVFEEVSDFIIRYKNLIKSKKIDLLALGDLESIYDKVTEEIYKNEKRVYANSFFSKKYKKLLSWNNINALWEIKDSGYSRAAVQKVINKMAKYKTPEELNEVLSQELENLNKFNMRETKNKLSPLQEGRDYLIVDENQENDTLIINICSYNASKILGSKNWCISTSSSMFNNYVGLQNKQFFLFDYRQKVESPMSMIGFTVDTDNKIIKHAHSKYDRAVKPNFLMLHLKQRNISFNDVIKKTREELVKNTLWKMNSDPVDFRIFVDYLGQRGEELDKDYIINFVKKKFNNIKIESDSLFFNKERLMSIRSWEILESAIGVENLKNAILESKRDNLYDNNFLKIFKQYSNNKNKEIRNKAVEFINNYKEVFEDIIKFNNDVINIPYDIVKKTKFYDFDKNKKAIYLRKLASSEDFDRFNPKMKKQVIKDLSSINLELIEKEIQTKKKGRRPK